MQMDAGLDTGPMLSLHRAGDRARTTTRNPCTTGSPRSAPRRSCGALADIARRARTARAAARGRRELCAKDRQGRTPKSTGPGPARTRAPGSRAAPVPGARTQLRGEPVKVWRARCVAGSGVPGDGAGSRRRGRSDRLRRGCAAGHGTAARGRHAPGARRISCAAFRFTRGEPLWRRSLKRWLRRRRWSRASRRAAACRPNWNVPPRTARNPTSASAARSPTCATARCAAMAARRRSSRRFRAAPAPPIRWSRRCCGARSTRSNPGATPNTRW